jgi:hypothetical protein
MSGLDQDDYSTSDPDDFDRGSGDPEIGRELTQFFLYLLSDGQALRDYYDRSTRNDVIGRQGFSTAAGDLLRDGTLKEIEEHILAIRGSYAKPLVIVWPPM